jgi:hypothetical protein
MQGEEQQGNHRLEQVSMSKVPLKNLAIALPGIMSNIFDYHIQRPKNTSLSTVMQ